MITTTKVSDVEYNDAGLVAESRAGDRDAFAQIVTRYQSLVCSLAYSATGSLGRSEDLAQETFVTAWQHLTELREPSKLRPWLCGITRNLIGKELRRQGREPVHAAEPLDAIHESPTPEPSPSAQAISREEEAILWRALERIPDTYREPLILFYREHQSVERVAEELELSQEAVKQRLSRGRKLLTEEVAAFVEGTLKRTTPGKAFTVGVLAALPVLTASSQAATIGALAVKGSATAKAAASVGLAGMILGPIIGLLGGWLGAKMSIENTESPRERQFMIKMAWIALAFAGVFCLAILACTFGARFLWKTHPLLVAAALIAVITGYFIALAVLIVWGNRTQRRIRREEDGKLPPGTFPRTKLVCFQPFEYRSRWVLLGLPLIHIRTAGTSPDEKMRHPAMGWIAIGDTAVGVLLAVGGGAAVGLFAIGGGAAVGLFAVGGGFAAGLLSLGGGFAFGVWALGGGLAVGLLAFGGCAAGWTAAQGGLAVAHEFARGGVALARHANDPLAAAFFKNSAFFHSALVVMRHAFWLNLLWLLPLLLLWRRMRLARDKKVTGGF